MNKFKHYYYNKLLKEADSKEGFVDHVILDNLYIKELPMFLNDLTTKHFNVSYNLLTSCKNFPKVLELLHVNYNNIVTLDGIKNLPTNFLAFIHNKIKSAEALSEFNTSCGEINLGDNLLKSAKGLENIKFTDTLLLYSNELTSWDFFPVQVNGLYIQNNKLSSWKGMPEKLTILRSRGNWDVKNLNDFKPASGIIDFSSSTLSREVVREKLMEEYNVSVNDMPRIYITNE